MTHKIIATIFAFLIFFTPFIGTVNAQSNSTNGMFVVDEPSCGIAGDPKANKCCNLDFANSFDKQSKDAESTIPSGVVQLFSAILGAMKELWGSAPVFKAMTGPCVNGIPNGTGASCTCVYPPTTDVKPELQTICKRFLVPQNGKSKAEQEVLEKELNSCIRCAAVDHGYYSAIGCVPDNLSEFISNFVLRIGIGIAGFIAMMCIIYSSFLLQVSRGNPEMITKAREQITSCIIGLIMIIFSVFILRLIGVDILRIPGFS